MLITKQNTAHLNDNGSLSTSRIRTRIEIKKEIKADPEKKKLYDAALEFQSIFLNMMIKSMRKTLHPEKNMLFGGRTEEIFTDMLYDEHAKVMSRTGSYGLAENIYRQMAPSLNSRSTLDSAARKATSMARDKTLASQGYARNLKGAR